MTRAIADDILLDLHRRLADAAAGERTATIVVLAVKPQVMGDVCRDIAPVVQNTRPLMVSIAAGLTADTLDTWLGGGLPLVRVMPNTPSLVGKGAAGLFANSQVKDDQRNAVQKVFESIGSALWVDDENLLHSVTALSGSGPAYFFLMLEALEAAATEAGIESDYIYTSINHNMACTRCCSSGD